MAIRFRANLKFNQDGIDQVIAQWCDDQASQHFNMAYHINEGAKNEEDSFHLVENNGEIWRCNMFVPDGEKAIMEDLFNQIDSIWHYIAEPEDGMGMRSYMDIHVCHNDENTPCESPYMRKVSDSNG